MSTSGVSLSARYGAFVLATAHGAVGNGTTNDTAAIQAAIDAVAASGGVVFFPPGNYKTTTPLDFTQNGVTLMGASRNLCKITNNDSDVLHVSGTHNLIEGLSIWSNGENGHIFNQVGGWSQNRIRNCQLLKLGDSKSVWHAIGSTSGDYIDNVVEGTEFYHSYTATVPGWYYLRDSSGASCNRNTWRDLRWNRSGSYAFHLEASTNRLYDNHFEDINFEVCNGGAIKLLSVTGTMLVNCVNYDNSVLGAVTKDLFVIGKNTGVNSSHNTLRGIFRRGGALGAGVVDIRFHVASGSFTQIDKFGSASSADVFTADLGSGIMRVTDYQFVTFQNDTFASKQVDGLVSAQGYAEKLATKTANYTATAYDSLIVANGAAVTITLPSAVTAGAGRRYTVKNINAAAATVGATAGTIDGAATDSLVQWESARYVSDGANWFVA